MTIPVNDFSEADLVTEAANVLVSVLSLWGSIAVRPGHFLSPDVTTVPMEVFASAARNGEVEP